MSLSVVIPAHDEAANLETCVAAIEHVLGSSGHAWEIVVVDDGSTDDTWAVLARVRATDDRAARVRGIRFSRNFGKEAAISAGLHAAHGDAVIVMDADMQHPPDLIPQLVEPWAAGRALIVEAVKSQRQRESIPKRLAARTYYRLFELGSGLAIRDATDFKLLDRKAVAAYLQLGERRRFFRGLTRWLGMPTERVPMAPGERAAGASSWRLSSLLDLARTTLISFSSWPLRLITWGGVLGLMFAFGLGIQTLWMHFRGYAEEGFPTVIILQLGMGSAILASLGLIGEYVAAIYEEVKARPPYVVLDATESPPPQPDPDAGA